MLVDELVQTAYLKLKQTVYHDKTDVFLRKRIAEFECSTDFEARLSSISQIIASNEPYNDNHFKAWLDQISFRIVPKTMPKMTSNNSGNFITNLTSAKQYNLERVNYFFDGPVELHVLAVLWILIQGRILDRQLSRDCYGTRIASNIGAKGTKSLNLFKKYHELYAEWRDAGIRTAKTILTENKRSVYILGLDIKEYYYHINLDFKLIADAIEANLSTNDEDDYYQQSPQLGYNLLHCLELIYHTYQQKTQNVLKATHEHLHKENTGIAIGLCTSPLLANWYLREFDLAVREKIRPSYYGRYVDDILMVIPSEEAPAEHDVVEHFINNILVKSGLLYSSESTDKNNKTFKFVSPQSLCLQLDKCILQYFDAKHSIAGLEKFKKKLEENASDFMLLPVEEEDGPLEDVAYDLLYAGSVNKFRSVKGVAENRYELARHLSRQSMAHLLTDDKPDAAVVTGIEQFFRGSNAIEYCDLWERAFTFFAITGLSKAAEKFAKQLYKEIKRVRLEKDPETAIALQNSLKERLALSREIAEALITSRVQAIEDISGKQHNIWRDSNLIRHHFVAESLFNYTDYQGSLLRIESKDLAQLDERKVKYSPRYVHFDELMLLATSERINIGSEVPFAWAQAWYAKLNDRNLTDIEYIRGDEEMDNKYE